MGQVKNHIIFVLLRSDLRCIEFARAARKCVGSARKFRADVVGKLILGWFSVAGISVN